MLISTWKTNKLQVCVMTDGVNNIFSSGTMLLWTIRMDVENIVYHYTGNSLAGVAGLINVLLPLWSTYVECCNCPPLFCCCRDDGDVIGWVVIQFDNWFGVADTGDWFEEPPNREEEEEIMELLPTFLSTSEKKAIV